MISVRLSDDEFNKFVNASLTKGARSTSDLARMAICQFLGRSQSLGGETQIRERMDRLEGEIRRLDRLVESIASMSKGGA